jgi:hypothetical protein
MRELINSLNDFTVDNYKDISDAVVMFDANNIDNEMVRQASIYSYYHGLMVTAKKFANDKETDLTRLMAKLRSGYKHNTTAKLTAKDLDDLVMADDSYNLAQSEVHEAIMKYELLKGLVRSLEQKKDMLQQVSANRREETKLYK